MRKIMFALALGLMMSLSACSHGRHHGHHHGDKDCCAKEGKTGEEKMDCGKEECHMEKK